ncbi:phosphoribosylformylglycinamidine synthase [Clostridium magnum]|uniref:Phosphoribosylformylglycinamidine synthase 2 n=1 Tax=Clostridium magnum DSM 2767 TaxID=1121326 RepID=A0A161X418_9CLOT|nr:phosphoribosylformylglycinamidine synthase [Clostridium magnum]KZL94268.1 phosphoribosylformylglycinamidine synthase 2 [Clostridium magnum DSM 2767]SHH91374.1 phosphoribosylformylglycinamidine synthase [Clostridium magnum DSM 2767]
MIVRRLFIEKKEGINMETQNIFLDLRDNLDIKNIKGVRVINRYDIFGISDEEYEKSKNTIFSEKTVDNVYEEELNIDEDDNIFAVEYLPGQYDQRSDSASQCIQILTQNEKPEILSAKIYVIKGNISKEEFSKIKDYCINKVDSREASLEKPKSADMELEIPDSVEILDNFINMNNDELKAFLESRQLAMTLEDLKFCQQYFRDIEKRNPTITEIKVIDTYWSDHCRHTTFMTELTNIEIKEGNLSTPIREAYEQYLESRKSLYVDVEKPVTLMDMAVIGMKELRKNGLLDDLDQSEEINACSIVVDADIDGKLEKWLVMFKNETHNHPTEIEPFGGAATCLGGAIRDPLSGRSYVYQAMRVTGSGNPKTRIEDTLSGKLPQKKITTSAAHGYSSYGNQIGLATGQVAEIYDEGYVAKRMEIGAVIGAAPMKNVIRKEPTEGDVVILVGGRTGRDGCGGATGSSKKHTENSILSCGSEVQKGNPVVERKIQRLFRKEKVSSLIKRCNDFGAGGVSVAIGELTDGLNINLDLVPKKYDGLDGTELAISESQERMAVVVAKKDEEKFMEYAAEENLEATTVAVVTSDKRLKMNWNGKAILDLSRDFLNTNGVRGIADVTVEVPEEDKNYFKAETYIKDIKEQWINILSDLNVCSQKGLVESFDSTIGSGTVIMPFGGKYQLTPAEGMVAKLPVLNGETKTGTIMTYGYNPNISKWSPFHGAVYAVVESVAKIVACGGDASKIRLTFQEYFEKLGKDPIRWGKPFAALLGALLAQKELGIAAIGGKDSMSGTFKDMDVPPTLVSFAVNVVNVDKVISPEFKKEDSKVVIIPMTRDEYDLPNFDVLKKNLAAVTSMIINGDILASSTVKRGGICEAVSKMSFGNKIGMKFAEVVCNEELFAPQYGSIIIEVSNDIDLEKSLSGVEYKVLGTTQGKASIDINNVEINIDDMLKAWENTLESIFPTNAEVINDKIQSVEFNNSKIAKAPAIKVAKPKVFIPVFPGTNCEYDSERAFAKAGADVETMIFKNLTGKDIEKSIDDMVKAINNSQIVMLPGGFSAGDEPDGSGKFIATIFRNPKIKEAVMELLKNRDGLMLGICNGFQALIKLGLVPFGEIRDIDEECPTLTYNKIARHVSSVSNTKIVSNLSPWLSNVNVGDIHSVPVSHGEGRFVANDDVLKNLISKGQVATQYVDFEGNPTYDIRFNPNGSVYAIEGITSPDGRVFGKMAHSERIGDNVLKNISGNKDQKIFEAGVQYFK